MSKELVKRLHGPNGPWKVRDQVMMSTETLNKAAEAIISLLDRIKELEDCLETIAAQSSGKVGSTALSDCMAALARAAISASQSKGE